MTPDTATSHDTIVALSSSAGRSPRSLLRLSGPASDDVFAAMVGVPFDMLPPVRTVAAMKIDIGLGTDRLPCLVARFAPPRSFTGEAMIELQVPGNPALIDRVLHRIIGRLPAARGVRLAHPGEFSLRAYLHHKIDLTQAEGIAATIAAHTDAQLAAATLLRKGRLGDWARDLVQLVAEALALVEAGIDFTDQEDVVPISPRALAVMLATITARLDDLLARSRSWGALQTLPRVVLVGEPSAGKSTLFNALLKNDRAVTSPTPGTTRDVLEEPIDLPATPNSPIAIRATLIDIAGLDNVGAQPDGQLAADIQAAARNAIASADLIVHVTSAQTSSSDPNPSLRLKNDFETKPVLAVQSKSDTLHDRSAAHPSTIAVSALQNIGLDALRHGIAQALAGAAASLTAETLALQPRHEDAIRSARASLADAVARVAPQIENRGLARPEVIAGALRESLDALACLGGEMTPDDVIGLVFARFCVGK